ncbi:MAG: ABC transporter permease [Deltaproteobacteria bacterium]|nr:ABC transporter permease [Deltaproteobacteria bacterium]
MLVFLLIHVIPGDPVDNLLGEHATAEDRAKMRECMGLDLGMADQFGRFLGGITDGTLGRICPSKRVTVTSLIARAFPRTLELAFAGMAMALLMALPLGIAAALRRGSGLDAGAMGLSLVGLSVPYMVLGPVLIMVFYVKLGWLPGPADPPSARGALVLPAFALGLHLMAILSRMTRSSMLDVLGEDYMRTARAKGLTPTTVIVKHGLRNALIPIITIVGIQFGGVLSGAILIEKIFARPGMGTLLIDAISERNYPVIQGCVLCIAVTYVLVNLLVDIAYGLVDPRIRVN